MRLTHGKFSLNDNFFNIPNKIACYYAGLLAADGCCINKNQVVLSLQAKDLQHLERFKTTLEFTGNIWKFRNKVYNTIHYKLQFSSKQIREDLLNHFNISSQKSLTLLPPNLLERDLCLSYIAGLIDGDGCIGNYQGNHKKKISTIEVVGTQAVMNWVKVWCDIVTPSTTRVAKVRKIKYANCYEYRIGGPRANRFYQLIKTLDLPLFERKWSKLGDDNGITGLHTRERSTKTGRFI